MGDAAEREKETKAKHVFGSVKGKTCGKRCSTLQGRFQCSARADAVHCKGGCSALRERLQCTASEMGKNWYRNLSPFSGYLHRNNTGLARVHYIYVQLSEESSPQKRFFALPQYLILKKCEEEREKPQTWGESVKGRLLPPVRRDRATAVHPSAYS